MPYTTHWEETGIRWVFTGEVSDQDIISCCMEFYDDPKFLDIRYLMADYSAISNFNVNSDTIFDVAQMDKDASEKNPYIKVATIASSQLLKGITRMWELSGGTTVWESQLFDSEVSAREWLNG